MAKNPKYVGVYKEIKSAIVSGQYKSGDFLPTIEKLAAQFGVSLITVRHAVQLLKDDGYVLVRQGQGIQVAPTGKAIGISKRYHQDPGSPSMQYAREEGSNIKTTPLYIEQVAASLRIAEALDVEPGTELYRVQRINTVDDQVVTFVTSYLRCELAPGLPARVREDMTSLHAVLENEYGLCFDEGREVVRIVKANLIESKVMNQPVDTPLFQMERTWFADNGILEFCETIANPELFSVVISIKKVD